MDDSIVAMQQAKAVLSAMGFIVEMETDGSRAFKKLQALADSGAGPPHENLID